MRRREFLAGGLAAQPHAQRDEQQQRQQRQPDAQHHGDVDETLEQRRNGAAQAPASQKQASPQPVGCSAGEVGQFTHGR